MGNICRSPSAEGVFRRLVEEEGLSGGIEIDSAGTHSYHVGGPPDDRAREAALRRGIDIAAQRARQARRADFTRFDYILAMDRDNYDDLARLCPPGREERLKLFLDFAPHLKRSDVPDPYFGGDRGFEAVLDLIEAASAGLLAHIRRHRL